MILILLIWGFIFLLTGGLGFVAAKLLYTSFGIKEKPTSMVLVLLGFVFILTLAQFYSFYLPLNLSFIVFLSLGSLLVWIKKFKAISRILFAPFKQLWALSLPIKLIFVLGFFLALSMSASPGELIDEGGYYLPFIRWLENYPLMPGLANIEDRLGFNSTFHLLSAIFGFTFIFEGGLYDLTGFLCVLLLLQFSVGYERLLTGNFDYLAADLIKVVFLIFPFRAKLTVADADYAHLFLGLFLLTLWIEKTVEQSFRKLDGKALLIIVLSIWLITIKFLAIFYFLFPVLLLFLAGRQKNWKPIVGAILLGGIFIVPWVVRNYILSGYWIYPLTFLSFPAPDWQVPWEIARGQYTYVSEHATFGISRNYRQFVIREIHINEWWPYWLAEVKVQARYWIFLLGVPLTIPMWIYLILKRKKWDWDTQFGYFSLGIISTLFLLFWFFRYPDIRFGWAWIIGFVAVPWSIWMGKILTFKRSKIGRLVIIFLTMVLFRHLVHPSQGWKQYLTPASVNKAENFQTIRLDEVPVKVVADYYCWGLFPPCLPVNYNPLLQLRGDRLEEGFHIKKE